MRLIHPSDCQNALCYPLRIFETRPRRRQCRVCDTYAAKYVSSLLFFTKPYAYLFLIYMHLFPSPCLIHICVLIFSIIDILHMVTVWPRKIRSFIVNDVIEHYIIQQMDNYYMWISLYYHIIMNKVSCCFRVWYLIMMNNADAACEFQKEILDTRMLQYLCFWNILLYYY